MENIMLDSNTVKELQQKLDLLVGSVKKLDSDEVNSETETKNSENQILETYKDIGRKTINIIRANDDKFLVNTFRSIPKDSCYCEIDNLINAVDCKLYPSEMFNILSDYKRVFSREKNFGKTYGNYYLDRIIYFLERSGNDNGYITSRLLKYIEIDKVCNAYQRLAEGKINEEELSTYLNEIFDKCRFFTSTSFEDELPNVKNIVLLDTNLFWFYGYSGLVKLYDDTYNIIDDEEALIFPYSTDVVTAAKNVCIDMINKEIEPELNIMYNLRERDHTEKCNDFDELINLGVELNIFNPHFTKEACYEKFYENID